MELPNDSGIRSDGARSQRPDDLVWGKGFRRVSIDPGKPLTRSEQFVGPRLFVKHYPDGRADEYVYADKLPVRINLPLIISLSALYSIFLPMLGRSMYNDLVLDPSPVQYILASVIVTSVIIGILLIILGVLIVKYFKAKDIIFEEMPASADPREKGKNYSGNFTGKAVQRETPIYNEQFVPKKVFSSVSLILLTLLMLAGLGALGFGAGLFVTPADDHGYAVVFMVLGGFWVIMSLIGFASSISSLANAKKMAGKIPPPPAAKKQDVKPSNEAKADDDEDYIRMKRKGFE